MANKTYIVNSAWAPIRDGVAGNRRLIAVEAGMPVAYRLQHCAVYRMMIK